VPTEGTVLIHRLNEGRGKDEIQQTTKPIFLYEHQYFNKYNLIGFRVKMSLIMYNVSIYIILFSSNIYTLSFL